MQHKQRKSISTKYKYITEKPYTIKGATYVPQLHYGYRSVGMASWYSTKESTTVTSMGTRYHNDLVTVAHRTLPLPSVVRITNLNNGKVIYALVNDRGPFAHTSKRIIDLSPKAAALLGFKQYGYTPVLVECLPEYSRQAAIMCGRKPY